MNIGDRVRIVTKWPEENIFLSKISPWRFNTFEGTIVRGNPTLDPEGTFNLLTGNPEHPVSIIQHSRVERVERLGVVKGSSPRANRTRYVMLTTVKGKEHRIEVYSTKRIACDCVGFGYRKNCTHVGVVREFLVKKYGLDWTKEVFK